MCTVNVKVSPTQPLGPKIIDDGSNLAIVSVGSEELGSINLKKPNDDNKKKIIRKMDFRILSFPNMTIKEVR